VQLDFWQLVAGLGLFLFAMRQLETALRDFAGRSFKRWLQSYTDRPHKSVIAGTLTTAVLQSSSLVGLMVLAFVGAGIMSLENALGVIYGANLGTTVTGWLVAAIGFKLELEDAALPFIGIGTLLLVATRGGFSTFGRVASALGFLLLGLAFMKDSVSAINDLLAVGSLAGFPLWRYVLFGAVFAGVLQSSSATLMITLTALFGGVIDLTAGAAIAIGANLGTTSTVLIGSIQGSSAKRRVAVAHFLFNFVTFLVAFALLGPILTLIGMIGIEDPIYALVAFHSLFNLIGIVIFLPIVRPFARFLENRFVDKVPHASLYVGEATASVADAALAAVAEETAHLIARVIRQNMHVFSPALPEPPGRLPVPGDFTFETDAVSFDDLYRKTKQLEGEIIEFAVKVQAQPLESEESARLNQLLAAVRNAVHSAKSMRDIRQDLVEFEDSPRRAVGRYLEHFRSVMTALYGELFRLRREESAQLVFQDFADLIGRINDWHDQLHREMFADIKSGRIDQNDISSLLNVNREMLSSNIALVMALTDFHLDADAAEALRQLRGTA